MKIRNIVLYYKLSLFILLIIFFSCKIDTPVIDIKGSDYPEPVGKIILNKCAVSGCHNSTTSSADLDLSSWKNLFKGAKNGAVVIPFWHNQSSLFTFSNVHSDLGIINKPTMPPNAEPLSKEEIITLKDWINLGAPNSEEKSFTDVILNKNRYYVANQGCDLIAEIDPVNFTQLRYVKVGTSAITESPHQVHVSPNGEFIYVVMLAGLTVEKYSTQTMQKVGAISLNNGLGNGNGNWNTFVFTKDEKHAFVVDWSPQGVIDYMDLEQMKVIRVYAYDWLKYPHGIFLHPNGNLLYVLSQSGNALYKIDITNPLYPALLNIVSLDGNPIQYDASSPNSLNPHDIRFTTDGSRYLVTCQKTNDVRIYDASTDAVLAKIPVGSFPQEVVVSQKYNMAYVTCPEDTVTNNKLRGTVAIIDLNTLSLVKKVYTGHQPHGIAVDDANSKIIVANRNQSDDGPAPHHTSECGGRNGNLVSIDANTLMLNKKKIELSVDPYFVSIKY